MATATTTTATECAICIEKFNASRRKRIICPYCPTDGTETPYCCACAKTYLLQDDAHTPRCAACQSGWTEDYMSQTFAKTWLLKEYKAHREVVLLDVERARLPEAQEDAARYRRALQVQAQYKPRIDPLVEQLKNLPELAAEMQAYQAYGVARNARVYGERETGERSEEHWLAENAAWRAYHAARANLAQARRPINSQLAAIHHTEEYRLSMFSVSRFGQEPPQRGAGAGAGAGAAAATAAESTRSRWTFVMKCPLAECQGFVGTNWKCGLCEVAFCKECGEREDGEEGGDGHGHRCNPDTVATFKAMRKEAKPCPKCAAMISKIDGCDQMWCTQCQTAFSWRTGQIETTHVHNPHYFQWMRQHNNGEVPLRPAGDCLNLEPQELLEQVLHYARRRMASGDTSSENRPLYLHITEWVRVIRHNMAVQREYQYKLREKQNDEWRRQLRVKRLVGEITDAIWKDRLQRGEKAAQKIYAVLQILDVFVQAGTDLLRTTLPEDADIYGILMELEALRKFCNSEMTAIERRYNNEVVYFTSPGSIRKKLDQELIEDLAQLAQDLPAAAGAGGAVANQATV